MTKPRVHARHSMSATEMRTMTSSFTTPGVTVSVEFDHGDVDEALSRLEWSVKRVREQIESTRPGAAA